MEERFLDLYEEELAFLREMGAEFAVEHPKIARRLSLDEGDVQDPYVERLLEGFSFLSARIRLRLENEFPEFTNALLDLLSPIYNAQTPSMAVLKFDVDPGDGALAQGYTLARGASFLARIEGIETPCDYRLAHDLTLRPLMVDSASYSDNSTEIASIFPGRQDVKAMLRLTLRSLSEVPLCDMALDTLPVFLNSTDDTADALLRLLISERVALQIAASGDQTGAVTSISPDSISHKGFKDEEALLPQTATTFSAFRLLKEFFAMPERTRFVEFGDLRGALENIVGTAAEIHIGFGSIAPSLSASVSAENFQLNCAPVINLFPRRADRVPVKAEVSDVHVIVDRTRTDDFEVYSVEKVHGLRLSSDETVPFRPLYAGRREQGETNDEGYFAFRRDERRITRKRKVDYAGREVVLGLVDSEGRPPSLDINQLAVDTLCTNRGLSKLLRAGTRFSLQGAAPVLSITSIVGPTSPQEAPTNGLSAWRLINALSFNHLALAGDPTENVGILRQLVSFFADMDDPTKRIMVDGIVELAVSSEAARLPGRGPAAFARGLLLELTIDQEKFRGTGAFGFASIIEAYFGRAVAINSFTRLVLRDQNKGVLARWQARAGNSRIV